MSKEICKDPKGRYIKKELLGSGAFKTVFRAYDTEEGTEVAWNQVKLAGVGNAQKKKIHQEIVILDSVKHESIMEIYDHWETEDGDFLVFITELMSSGTLKDFLRKSKKVRLRNIKKWCRQLLEGLDYLHSHDPPIIHRDLKCENIFMNGSRGEVKIGDLGLSICMKDKKFASSVIGTPEYMAPELYEECYNEKVDIYAFGLCVLEMVTGDYPYSECENVAQVYKKVTNGLKPEGIEKIKDTDIKDFINLCICHRDIRPSARQLMYHPFLTNTHNNDCVLIFDHDGEEEEEEQELEDVRVVLVNESNANNSTVDQVTLKLYIKIEGTNKYKEIKFPFNLRKDTPRGVSSEMVNELNLADNFVAEIANAIATTLQNAKLTFLAESDSSLISNSSDHHSNNSLVSSFSVNAATSTTMTKTSLNQSPIANVVSTNNNSEVVPNSNNPTINTTNVTVVPANTSTVPSANISNNVSVNQVAPVATSTNNVTVNTLPNLLDFVNSTSSLNTPPSPQKEAKLIDLDTLPPVKPTTNPTVSPLNISTVNVTSSSTNTSNTTPRGNVSAPITGTTGVNNANVNPNLQTINKPTNVAPNASTTTKPSSLTGSNNQIPPKVNNNAIQPTNNNVIQQEKKEKPLTIDVKCIEPTTFKKESPTTEQKVSPSNNNGTKPNSPSNNTFPNSNTNVNINNNNGSQVVQQNQNGTLKGTTSTTPTIQPAKPKINTTNPTATFLNVSEQWQGLIQRQLKELDIILQRHKKEQLEFIEKNNLSPEFLKSAPTYTLENSLITNRRESVTNIKTKENEEEIKVTQPTPSITTPTVTPSKPLYVATNQSKVTPVVTTTIPTTNPNSTPVTTKPTTSTTQNTIQPKLDKQTLQSKSSNTLLTPELQTAINKNLICLSSSSSQNTPSLLTAASNSNQQTTKIVSTNTENLAPKNTSPLKQQTNNSNGSSGSVKTLIQNEIKTTNGVSTATSNKKPAPIISPNNTTNLLDLFGDIQPNTVSRPNKINEQTTSRTVTTSLGTAAPSSTAAPNSTQFFDPNLT
ncbi:hypothetical protein ABK040_015521 [Willaertia magna]